MRPAGMEIFQVGDAQSQATAAIARPIGGADMHSSRVASKWSASLFWVCLMAKSLTTNAKAMGQDELCFHRPAVRMSVGQHPWSYLQVVIGEFASMRESVHALADLHAHMAVLD
jgi:hypothetical protein